MMDGKRTSYQGAKYGACISGVGAYEPEEVRGNDYWPQEIVEHWAKKKRDLAAFAADAAAGKDYIHPLMREEMQKLKGDPFLGFVRRRVAPRDMLPSEMELHAAKEALADAGVEPLELDAVMSFSLPPDHDGFPTVFKVHHELGAKNAMALGAWMLCCSINAQLEIAAQYIMNGTWRHALAVVSTKYSDVMDYSSSLSVLSGDGAGAFVISRCEPGRGLLGSYLRSWTEFHDSMIFLHREPEVRPKPRYAYGWNQRAHDRIYLTFNEKAGRVLGVLPSWAEESRAAIIERTGTQPNDADILVTNAAHVWYSRVVAKMMGVDLAKIEDNVLEYGNMGAVNLAMNLYKAVRKGRIQDGTKVLMFGHGGGASYGAQLLDWVGKQ